MADIELVIKIPKEKYQGIINRAEEILDESTFCSPRYLYKAVLNGTLLPKGHGALKDTDALMKLYGLEDATKYGNETAEQQTHSYSTMMMYEIADMLDDAPTLIKADTESEEA